MTTIADRLERAAQQLGARAATTHERVACPRCGAERGEACRRIVGGVGLRTRHNRHSHVERLRADGISLR